MNNSNQILGIDGFATRLQVIISDNFSNLSQRAIAKTFGISQSALMKYLNGQSLPGLEYFVGIAKGANVNLVWLATGEGPMLKRKADAPVRPEENAESNRHVEVIKVEKENEFGFVAGVEPEKMMLIDLCDIQISAGGGSDGEVADDAMKFDKMGKMGLSLDFVKDLSPIKPKNLLIARVRGDSMERTLYDGDYVILEHFYEGRWQAAFKGDDVYVIGIDDDIMVKRLQRIPGRIRIISDNDRYQTIEMPDELAAQKLRVFGRVLRRITRM